MIVREFDRLGIESRWRETLLPLVEQLDSGHVTDEASLMVDGEFVGSEELARPSFAILEALRHLDMRDSRELRLVALTRAIAALPLFFQRARRDGEAGPEFWDPLSESFEHFVARDPDRHVRRYIAADPLPPRDVVQARVFRELDGER